jgi:hypothetical protein
MNTIIYIVGLVVVIGAILGFFGLLRAALRRCHPPSLFLCLQPGMAHGGARARDIGCPKR